LNTLIQQKAKRGSFSMPKTITLHRPVSQSNRYRDYVIESGNGKELGVLKHNQTLALEVPDDVSYIRFKLMWCGSEVVNLQNVKQDERILVTPNRFFHYWMPFLGAPAGILSVAISNYYPGLAPVLLGGLTGVLILIISSLTVFRYSWLRVKVEAAVL
jgi:hypothetical protein